MRYSDLHIHTVFSDGINTVEEMVRAAVEQGMPAIGISDHSHTPFDLRYCMKKEVTPAYHAEVERVRKQFAGQIQVYTGLEWDGYTRLEDRERYDYLIGGCHYVKTWDGYHSVDHTRENQKAVIDTYFCGDPNSYAKAYFETYAACTAINQPDILGHFDLLSKYGLMQEEDPAYRTMATEALLACLEITPILELNTGAIARGVRDVPYPADFLLRETLAHGGSVMLASDAHRAEQIGFWFKEGMQRLKEIGFHSIMVFEDGMFRNVEI